VTTEEIAAELWRVYGQLAPFFGCGTESASWLEWSDVADRQRDLLVAVIDDLVVRRIIERGPIS
jgi:hypothetical protein